MFTTVNSERSNGKHHISIDAENSSSILNEISTENGTSIPSKLINFFSVSDDYFNLQLAIFCLTFALSLFISLLTAFLISRIFGLSLFVGSITGIFYLRLLAKSIGNLGKTSSGVSKLQLLLPVCLFIFASKNELIQILPAMIGFFLYKPSLFLCFSRS